MLQGRPRDHDEYVIYEKRRALIEYVIFYSVPSIDSSVNDSGLDATELQCKRHNRVLRDGEFTNYESHVGQHDDDDSHCRSSTPGSGSSSPMSGRSTPADSDDGTNNVVPVTYEPVKRVNVVRQRTKPVTTQSGLCYIQSVSGLLWVCVCLSVVLNPACSL